MRKNYCSRESYHYVVIYGWNKFFSKALMVNGCNCLHLFISRPLVMFCMIIDDNYSGKFMEMSLKVIWRHFWGPFWWKLDFNWVAFWHQSINLTSKDTNNSKVSKIFSLIFKHALKTYLTSHHPSNLFCFSSLASLSLLWAWIEFTFYYEYTYEICISC